MTERIQTSGNFTAVTRTIQDGGTEWLELQITLTSGPVRLPVPSPMERRKVELRAESAALHLLGDELARAMDQDEEAKG